MTNPKDRLRHHVSGAIERGKAVPIIEQAPTFACVSVPGGWQTQIVETKELIGSVFNNVDDLWAWQGKYLKGQ
jgi:hypothetical protein